MREIGRILVGNLPYSILEATPKERKVLRDSLGVCHPHHGQILVRKGLHEQVRYETIAHELGHALSYGSGAREYLKGVLKDPEQIDEVEEMLLQIVVPMLLGIKGVGP